MLISPRAGLAFSSPLRNSSRDRGTRDEREASLDGLVPHVSSHRPHVGDGFENIPRARQQPMTGRQELHAASGAAEERHAELVFQALDLPAQRRL
jgi:hypothetical protein